MKDNFIRIISDGLTSLVTRIQNRSRVRTHDKIVEYVNFIKQFLNCLRHLDLEILNEGRISLPAIDLGDKSQRLCFQITTATSATKIKSILDQFSKHKTSAEYDQIFILILGKKPIKYPTDKSSSIVFDPSRHVVDVADLIKEASVLDVSRLKQLAQIVEVAGLLIPEKTDKRPHNLPYYVVGETSKSTNLFLVEIRDSFNSGTATVIHGPAGVGKTRAAVEYASRHADSYSARLFVTADTPKALERNLSALCHADILNLPVQHEEDLAVQFAAVVEWLQSYSDWLLIIDDVNSEEVASAINTLVTKLSAGHVIITSSLGDWADHITSLNLDDLIEDVPAMRMPGTGQTEGRAMQDQASGKDSMGRVGMISALGEFISSMQSIPPLSVTIEAPWGEGKSSALVQLRNYLKKNQRGRTVWFNPWRYTEPEALWLGFLAEFSEQMQEDHGFWKRLWIQRKYMHAIHGKWILTKCFFLIMTFPAASYLLRYWLTSQLPSTHDSWVRWFIDIGVFLAAWGPMIFVALKLWLSFRKPVRTFVEEMKTYLKKPDYAANRSSSERLHREFRAWLHACLKDNERVYVFIDDLDRCPGARAAELLEWLQLMMSNTGDDVGKSFPVVVVSGLDREKVAAAIAMRHADVLPILVPAETSREKAETAIAWGYEYLEKFVDLPVRLPLGSSELLEVYLQDLAPGAFLAEKHKMEHDLKRRRQSQAARSSRFRASKDVQTGNQEEPFKPLLDEPPSVSAQEDGLEDAGIPNLLRAAAVWLNYSPRRMKHFLNLLRLRWAIRRKMPKDRMTLQLTARLVLLETARPTLFRALADKRSVRATVFDQMDEESDGVFRNDGRWNTSSNFQLFAADRGWLERYGSEVLVYNWDDILHEGPSMRSDNSGLSPLTLEALNALIDGMPM